MDPLAASPAHGAIDITRPHPARMYDYYLGGKNNWLADREAARKVLAIAPEVRDLCRANRAFLTRVVRRLASEKGITQFLDIGTGMPTSPNVHETAAQHAPGARVVYVDNDPIVHTHANALLAGTASTKIVLADLRDPAAIISAARGFLDFSKPIALLLVAVLHFIPDTDNPHAIVAELRNSLPPGSWLAICHGTADFHAPEVAGTAAAVYDSAAAPLILRTRDEIGQFLDGFTVEEPGLVQVPLWRPEAKPKPRDLQKIGMYAALAARD